MSNKKDLIKIDDVTNMLPEKPARNTIYGWTKNKKIPFYKFGRTLFFSKEEVEKWNSNGRKMPI